MATELMEKVLEYLSQHDQADSLDLAKHFNVDHQKIIGAIKSLEFFEGVSTFTFILLFTICRKLFV